MNAIEHIRRNVFGLTQQEFAVVAGVHQSRVSRWESGESEPTRAEMAAIRSAAAQPDRKLKSKWNDRLFFATPTEKAGAAVA